MNNHWKTFLASRSAQIDDAGKVHFPAAPSQADCALVDLSALGLIAVRGPEAVDFLQGQLTCDVAGLAVGYSRLGGHCSPKGRMLSSFRVFKLDDLVYLQLPRIMVEATSQRLRMYLLRAKATIEDASDQMAAIGLVGACGSSLLARHMNAVPQKDDQLSRKSTADGDLIALRIPGSVPRFAVLGPVSALGGVWDDLGATASVVNPDFWRLLDIRAGIPSVYPETRDAFVPQMVNLQLLAGVSFTKGCYTGQEVVARMRYLGKLKRRMYLAQARTAHQPALGEELYSPTSTSAQATGRIVDVATDADGVHELLVVVEIEAVEKGEVRLGGPQGPLLSFSEPPYGFDEED